MSIQISIKFWCYFGNVVKKFSDSFVLSCSAINSVFWYFEKKTIIGMFVCLQDNRRTIRPHKTHKDHKTYSFCTFLHIYLINLKWFSCLLKWIMSPSYIHLQLCYEFIVQMKQVQIEYLIYKKVLEKKKRKIITLQSMTW